MNSSTSSHCGQCALFSSTTIVAAFMAGLGLGSLLGGVVADRVGPRGCLLAFATSNAGIALFGWQSVSLFYRGYQALVPRADSVGAAFAFHFALQNVVFDEVVRLVRQHSRLRLEVAPQLPFAF